MEFLSENIKRKKKKVSEQSSENCEMNLREQIFMPLYSVE